MSDIHIQKLIHCIELEEKEQISRFSLDQQHTLRQLKAEGLALQPLAVTRKSFGYADYPEISFRLPYPAETGSFRDGAAIECFIPGEDPVKGVLLSLEGRVGEFRLFAPDFPDWIEDRDMGIKLAPDTRTTAIMKEVLENLEKDKISYALFTNMHNPVAPESKSAVSPSPIDLFNHTLNNSQRDAVQAVMHNSSLTIVHGPPGTGKTTTMVEAIQQLVKKGEKVLVSAPSNTAVDHIAKGLAARGIRLLRVGNTSKVDEVLYPFTPEGKMENSKEQKDIKQLRKRAEEFRRMALKYKRSFGKAEREQRNLLFKEVKNIRQEIKKIQVYQEEKMFEQAQVIAGTPIGIYDAGCKPGSFDTLVIDEAGQCMEPLAWCIVPLAKKWILAGDHHQLPPTVLSFQAAQQGLRHSILDLALNLVPEIHLLNTQYRMRKSIAGFSSSYFYKDLLETAAHLEDTGLHIHFIDTAGSGFQEKKGPDGTSLQNDGELRIIRQLLQTEALDITATAVIAPYSGQIAAARELLPNGLRISTVDSFQGQEMDNIIISLVRSNDDGEIGFLKDYRRMNVALTRAKEKLYVIGDSATLGNDPFFMKLMEYMEKSGNYRTVWEFDLT
ncbi:MAG: AAA domain-containing protein [Sphingobacteriales bacterium]|jgi:superfamily I DNA and/or RNA helicase